MRSMVEGLADSDCPSTGLQPVPLPIAFGDREDLDTQNLRQALAELQRAIEACVCVRPGAGDDELGIGAEFRRTLVRAILTEEMGEAMANDPAFHAVIDDVYRMISARPEGQDLIDRAGRQLREDPSSRT